MCSPACWPTGTWGPGHERCAKELGGASCSEMGVWVRGGRKVSGDTSGMHKKEIQVDSVSDFSKQSPVTLGASGGSPGGSLRTWVRGSCCQRPCCCLASQKTGHRGPRASVKTHQTSLHGKTFVATVPAHFSLQSSKREIIELENKYNYLKDGTPLF